MSKENNKKTPKVRFPGFNDDWEEKKCKDIAPLQRGFDLPVSNMIEGKYPVVMSNGIGGYHNEYKVKGPGVITGRSGTIGKLQYIDTDYWPHNTSLWVTDFKGNYPKFVFYLYQKLNLSKFGTGSGVPTLNRNDVHDTLIHIPSHDEQKKISMCLDNLDHLITLHQRKLEKLKEYKKGMLQKMFPKNGEKIPEVRFPGFTDDWEQRKFSELCDMVTVGIANSATHAYSDSGIVMFRNQNIKPNFLDDNDIIHINPEFEARYKNKRLKKNDLLVARTGYPGTACVVPEKYENSQTFTTLIARPKNSVNPYFLCQYLNSDIGVKYFESTQIGGGQKNSGAGILNEMPIMLPSVVEEESKIADYFNHLDNLITLHQRKLEMLKEFKKGCLQQMFV